MVKRSTGGKTGQDSVANLVKSIHKHKKFKQLASYSVKCLEKVLTPPYNGWETNLQEAFSAGALDAISEVLSRHAGDEGVLDACTACLRSMATDSAMAAQLVQAPVMKTLMQSVTEQPNSPSAVAALQLLDTAARSSPAALLEADFVPLLTQLLQSSSHPPVQAACVRALERIMGVPGAAAQMREHGTVGALSTLLEAAAGDEKIAHALTATTSHSAQDSLGAHFDKAARGGQRAGAPPQSCLSGSMAMLERLGRTQGAAEEMKAAGVMGAVQKAMAAPWISLNSQLAESGGRLMGQLARGDVPTLLADFSLAAVSVDGAGGAKASQALSVQTKFLGQLCAEPEIARRVVTDRGAVGSLVSLLSTGGSGAQSAVHTAAANTVKNLCGANALAASSFLEAGLVPQALQLAAAEGSDVTAVQSALAAVRVVLAHATGADATRALGDDGLGAIGTALSEHAHDLGVFVEMVRLLDTMSVTVPHCADAEHGGLLCQEHIIIGVAAGILAFHDSDALGEADAAAAMRVLVCGCSCDAALEAAAGAEGLVSAVHRLTTSSSASLDSTLAGVACLGSLLLHEGSAAGQLLSVSMDALLAKCAEFRGHAKFSVLLQWAKDLLLVCHTLEIAAGSSGQADDVGGQLRAATEGELDMDACAIAALRFAVLCEDGECLSRFASSGALGSLVQLLGATDAGDGEVHGALAHATQAAAHALTSGALVSADGAVDVEVTVQSAKALLAATVASLRAGRGGEVAHGTVAAQASALRDLMLMQELGDYGMRSGAVEACVAALRCVGSREGDSDAAQAERREAARAASEALLALAQQAPTESCFQAAQKGGLRGLLAFLSGNIAQRDMQGACEAAAAALGAILAPLASPHGHAQLQRTVEAADTVGALCNICAAGYTAYFPAAAGAEGSVQLFADLHEATRAAGAAQKLPAAIADLETQAAQSQQAAVGDNVAPLTAACIVAGCLSRCAGNDQSAAATAAAAAMICTALVQEDASPACLGAPLLAVLRAAIVAVQAAGASGQDADSLAAACSTVLRTTSDNAAAAASLASQLLALCVPLLSSAGAGQGIAEGLGKTLLEVQGGSTSHETLAGLLNAARDMAGSHDAAVAGQAQTDAVQQWWQDAGQSADADTGASSAGYLEAAVRSQGAALARSLTDGRVLDDLIEASERPGAGQGSAAGAAEAVARLLVAVAEVGEGAAAAESGCLHRIMQSTLTQGSNCTAASVAAVLRAADALGDNGTLTQSLARQALRQHGADANAVQAASKALGLDDQDSAQEQLRQQGAALNTAAAGGADADSLAAALRDMAALCVVPALKGQAEASLQALTQAAQSLLVGSVDGEPLGVAGATALSAALSSMLRLVQGAEEGGADASTAVNSICSLLSLSLRCQHEEGEAGRLRLQLQLAQAAGALASDPATAAQLLLCGISDDLQTVMDVAQGTGGADGAAAAAAAQAALKRLARSAAEGGASDTAALQAALQAATAARDDELYRSIVKDTTAATAGEGALWGSLGGLVDAVGGAVTSRRDALRRGSSLRKASFVGDGKVKGSDAGEDAAVQAAASAVNFGSAHAAVQGLLAARGLEADAVMRTAQAWKNGESAEMHDAPAACGLDEGAAGVLGGMLVAADCAAVGAAAAASSSAARRNSSLVNLDAALQSSEDIFSMVTALLGQDCTESDGFVFDGASASAFSLSGGVAAMLAQLRRNMQQHGVAKSITTVLLRLAHTRSEEVLADFAAVGSMPTVVACAALYSSGQAADGKGGKAVPVDMDVVQTCSDIIKCVTDAFADSRCGLEAGGMQALITAQRTAAAAGHDAADALQLVIEGLSVQFDEKELQVMTSLLQALVEALHATLPGQALDPVGAMSDPDGTPEGLAVTETMDAEAGVPYFTDLVSEEVTWEAPEAYVAVRAALGPVQAAVKAQSMGMERVDGTVLSAVLHETAKVRRCGALVGDICGVLTSICARADNLGSLLDGSETLSDVNVMQLCSALFACNLNQRHGLLGALGLMRRLATRASCRVTLFDTGVLELVGEYIWQPAAEEDEAGNTWRHDGPIVAAAARVATALCVGLPEAQQLLVTSAEWLQALDGCLLQHCGDNTTADRLVTVCRNVAALNAEAAASVTKHAGTGLAAVLGADGTPEAKAPDNALQVVRYLCAQQDNAELLVCGTARLVSALASRVQHADVADGTAILACSVMDLLGDTAMDAPAIQEALTADGGTQAVIGLLESHAHSSDVLIAVCGALSSLLVEPDVVQGLHEQQVSIAQPLMAALMAFEWDVEVVTACFNAMIGAVDCDDVSAELLAAGVLERALDALDTYSEEELVVFTLAVLTRVCELEESLERLNARDGMRVLLHVLAAWSARSKAVVKGSFRLLQRVILDGSLAQWLANDGMEAFMGGMDAQMQHADVVERGLQIIAELALSQNTFASVLQFGGVPRITAAITKHPDDANVSVEAIIAMERIAMVSLEACEVVLDEGGRELVTGVMELHPQEEDVQVHGKSAIATMDALSSLKNVGEKVSGGAAADDSEQATKREQLLADFAKQRSALLSGNAMLKWDKKGPKSVVVRCTEDFRSLLWLNVKTGQKLGAIEVAMFTGVHKAPGALHAVSKGGLLKAKSANPACCFWIDTPRRQLFFETSAAPQAERWATTVQLLIDVCRATKGNMTA